MSVRVLMFGWEFPPERSGGLGVACYGLSRALMKEGAEVLFVLPRLQAVLPGPKFIFADVPRHEEHHGGVYRGSVRKTAQGSNVWHWHGLLDEVHYYALRAEYIALHQRFDVIHAHDWLTYQAGIAAKRVTGKPLVVHVHITSFDQGGGEHANPEIYAIEKEGFHIADKIIAVSNYTRNMVIEKYGISPEKVIVVHNGIDIAPDRPLEPALQELRTRGKQIVFYVGRITIQKGVDHFVKAAALVLQKKKDVMFVIAGRGDMRDQIIRQVADLGIAENIIFADLWDDERDRMFESSDLVVMPSVSEPFGLVPLEALSHGVPVLISKQSGVSEVLTHALKVDFWDTEEMANKILAVLEHPVLKAELSQHGKKHVEALPWARAARACMHLYEVLTGISSTALTHIP